MLLSLSGLVVGILSADEPSTELVPAVTPVRPPTLVPDANLVPEVSPVPTITAAAAAAGPPVHQIEQTGSQAAQPAVVRHAVDQAHAAAFDDDPYPSASKCRTCHPVHYREWSVSPHAYSQLSPVFNAMSSRLLQLTSGTLGDFCIRCHTPVGMARNEPIAIPNSKRHPVSREGVTCVVCHRVNQAWGKGAGRQALVRGNATQPIYGPLGNEVLEDVLADPDKYGVFKTSFDPKTRGRVVHRDVEPFWQMSKSGFCGTCHDVFAPSGFRLEDAFSEYKSSPSARRDSTTCQDCHMGRVPGKAEGYDRGPIAKVGNSVTPPRRRTSHMMIGPDYSIVHPGLFPHNPEAVKTADAGSLDTGLATIDEWLKFDYRQALNEKTGWGTPAAEAAKPAADSFPAPWNQPHNRFLARRILGNQLDLLREAHRRRHQILSAGYQLGHIEHLHVSQRGLSFQVQVTNGTNGHGVPTGFDAERLVFLQVTVSDSDGHVVFRSGDLDPNHDVRDSHSLYVHNGKLPLDRQLFSLQSKFVTRNLRGGEREQVLPIPFSIDPLPFVRPATRPFTVLGRPVNARKHKQNIEPGGTRQARYLVPPNRLTGTGPYQVNVKLIAAMVPVNLIQIISSAGFDYSLSAREVANRVREGHLVLHERNAQSQVR
jgi:hypothetical protein